MSVARGLATVGNMCFYINITQYIAVESKVQAVASLFSDLSIGATAELTPPKRATLAQIEQEMGPNSVQTAV
ncbi:hypothetical protein DdX_02955 [Ditylenchus destructor]|uniref:Uncharacterized protein n=1 Tax=Ditylenchus destructor TaxID=166010 RepID=A0AAD4NIH0_9BILA|nr:hypothetical protein DdX_02955 [Ditylenchus destructor]